MSSQTPHKPTTRPRFHFLMLIVLITSLMLIGCNDGDGKNTYEEATFAMELENSKGEPVSMEEFRGKLIFFNVWATWCPPCIVEMPGIHNLYEDVGEDPEIVFLMLSMDQDFDKAIAFREKYGYNFEIYRITGPMPAMYATKKIPTTFVINPEGYLVLQHDGVGEFDAPDFKKFFLEQKQAK